MRVSGPLPKRQRSRLYKFTGINEFIYTINTSLNIILDKIGQYPKVVTSFYRGISIIVKEKFHRYPYYIIGNAVLIFPSESK